MTIRGSGIGGVRPGLSTHSASSTKHRLSENASRSAFFAAARDAHLGLSRDAVAAGGGAPRGEWCGATGGSVGSRNTGRAGCRFNSAEAAAASHHRRSARRLCLQPGVWGPRWRMSRSRSSPFTLLITSPPCSPGGGPTPPPGGPSTPIPSTSSGQRVSATAAVHGTPPGSLSPPPSPRFLHPPSATPCDVSFSELPDAGRGQMVQAPASRGPSQPPATALPSRRAPQSVSVLPSIDRCFAAEDGRQAP